MRIKKRLKKLIGAALTLGMLCALTAPQAAFADSQRVVTLGANLSEAQKNSILKYFGVSENSVQIIYVTNQDERDRLASYVPLEQIGTRTFSCAYVQPTTKGGIQVKTANLNWVTSNMIAASLSTSGVKNCHVIAASPFEVSGTGALTGVLMAYEAATGESLNESKKEAAAQEIVTTGQVADTVGQAQATKIINDVKIKIIEDKVDEWDEDRIRTIIDDAVRTAVRDQNSEDEVETYMDEEEEFDAEEVLGHEELEALIRLGEVIAEQQYDIDDVRETLGRVEENVNTLIGITEGEEEEEFDFDEEDEDYALDEDSILMNTDDTALGDGVIIDATDDAAVQTSEDESAEAIGDEELPFEITTEDDAAIDDEDAADGETDDADGEDSFDGEDAGDEAFDGGDVDGEDAFDGEDAGDAAFDGEDADENGNDASEDDAAEEALDAVFTFETGGDQPSFGPVSLTFYTNGSFAPAAGSVVIEDMSGSRVAEIDLTDESNWGVIKAGSDTLDRLGFSSGNEIHVFTSELSLSDDQYQVSADIALGECDEDGNLIGDATSAVLHEESVFNYRSSGIGVSGDTADDYSRGSSVTLAIGCPEGAAYAMVESSQPDIADAEEPEVYPNEDSIARATVNLLESGKTTISVTYYSEDGEELGGDTIVIPVFK